MDQASRFNRAQLRRPVAVLAALFCWLGLLPAETPSAALAADLLTAQGSVRDEDRAADQSIQQLIDEAGRLRLTTGQSLDVVVARAAGDDQMIRRVISDRCRHGLTCRSPRGDLEIDVWLPVSGLNDALGQILRERLPQSPPLPVTWSRSNPPALLATGLYHPAGRPRDSHPGWRHCDARQIALARSAAAVDARAALLNQIAYLHVGDDRQLGFLLQRHRQFREALEQRIGRIALCEPVFEATGLCRQTISVAPAEVVSLLEEAYKETGTDRLPANVTRPTDLPASGAIAAEGFSVAPPAVAADLPTIKRPHNADRPAWADRFLVAQASGQAPADIGDARKRQAWAVRAARAEATRQLWMQLEELPMPGGETLSARLNRDLAAVAALADADRFICPTGNPVIADDGSTTVGVGIHLQLIWRMLSSLDRAAK
jgi:hypothetical protein